MTDTLQLILENQQEIIQSIEVVKSAQLEIKRTLAMVVLFSLAAWVCSSISAYILITNRKN